ncbi:hypothetical protein PENSPDRAFT_353582 [Peniophora sp. CONT]|nr:hypothetical protein PENSPDRAFT_353582 [Peniophora sp. CONT]
MTEFEREDILSQRRDERDAVTTKRQLAEMIAKQGGGDKDSVSQAAKREHGIRGATKEKTKTLEHLRAKRTERAEKRARGGSPGRERSSSPMDIETSEDDEDGQIGKDEQEDERLRRLSGGHTKSSSSSDAPIVKEDLNRIRLTRDLIAKHFTAPWFKDYVKGMWVKYLIGNEDGRPVYRACEVLSLSDEKVKPYQLNDVWVDQEFEIRHGQACKFWPMDKTSNAEFTDREFDRIVKVCKNDNIPFPNQNACEKKYKEMKTFEAKPRTESDFNAMLQRKRDLSGGMTIQEQRIRRAELQQARNHALKYNDHAELLKLDQQLAALGVTTQPSTPAPAADDSAARWAKVNEQNRKANKEAVRKIEQAEAERKKKERELRRLAASRTATPLPAGTPELSAVKPISEGKGKDFEASVLEGIEIDLGDF